MHSVFVANMEAAKMKWSAKPAMTKNFVFRLHLLFDSFLYVNIGQLYFAILSDSVFLQ